MREADGGPAFTGLAKMAGDERRLGLNGSYARARAGAGAGDAAKEEDEAAKGSRGREADVRAGTKLLLLKEADEEAETVLGAKGS